MRISIVAGLVLIASLSLVIGCNRTEEAKPDSKPVRAPAAASNSREDQVVSELDRAIRRNPERADSYATRAAAWMSKANYDRALSDYDQAIRLVPENAAFLTSRGFSWHMKGLEDPDRPKCEQKALTDYDKAIRLDPNNAQAINNRAWILATCKVAQFRNGKQAIVDATRACELTDWKNAGFLDTLSVACAETGDFEQATKWQKKALENLVYEQEDGKIAREKLALFSQRIPFRE